MSSDSRLGEHELLDAEKGNKFVPVWDMSQERAFIESLLNKRFNYFLIVFLVIMTGAFITRNQLRLQTILTGGAIISALLALVLIRSQEKLDLILAELFTDPSHPVTIINGKARKGGSRRKLVGIWIPSICTIFLICIAALAWCRIISVSARHVMVQN